MIDFKKKYLKYKKKYLNLKNNQYGGAIIKCCNFDIDFNIDSRLFHSPLNDITIDSINHIIKQEEKYLNENNLLILFILNKYIVIITELKFNNREYYNLNFNNKIFKNQNNDKLILNLKEK